MFIAKPKPARISALALVLALLWSAILSLLVAPQTALAGPGSGWVKADVVGGGCVETVNGTFCSSTVTPGSPTLYEYVPAREAYDQGVGPGRPHGGYPSYELRDECVYQGVNYGLAKGTWHQGARWTLTFRNGQEVWQGPTNRHWAFEHTDACRYNIAPTAVGATATPYGGAGGGSGTVPTNPPWTPPTITPFGVPETPTPNIPPTRVPTCYADTGKPTGLGIDARQGSTLYNYQTVGYYVPESYPGDPPGLYDDGVPTKVDPTWPLGRTAAPVLAGEPAVITFHPESVRMNTIPENPLAPFTQWGRAKMFLHIIDRGTNLASAADDRVLFDLDTDGSNPTEAWPTPVENGTPIVKVNGWSVASGVEVLGPMTWHNYEWSARNWFENRHSTDPYRGDYAHPNDAHWPRITPDIANQRVYLRSPAAMGFRFTPEIGHTYDVVSEVNKLSCGLDFSNYRLMRLSTASPIDVGISQIAPRITTPGAAISYRLMYENTTRQTSESFTITNVLPDGVTFTGASPAPASRNGRTLTWSFPPLAGQNNADGQPSRGEIIISVQVNETGPETLLNVATIQMANDSNLTNNRTEATTRVVYLPAPQADFRLRIHSDLDPQQGIYTSSGTAVKWPANEVMDFLPAITLQPAQQPGDDAYRVTNRIVAWSFVQVGNTPIGEPNVCKRGAQPAGSDLDGADLTGLDGCPYRYYANPTVADMQGMAHVYWSQSAPALMRDDVYIQAPLPQGPTQLVLEYAVLTTAQENGVDLDGDGSTNTIIVRKTTITRGAFQVTLLAPRSSR
jgi:hypothetical protein